MNCQSIQKYKQNIYHKKSTVLLVHGILEKTLVCFSFLNSTLSVEVLFVELHAILCKTHYLSGFYVHV